MGLAQARPNHMAGELTYGYGHFIQINLDHRMETLHAVGYSFSSCTRTILGPTTVHCVAVIDAFIVSCAPKCAGSDDVYTTNQLKLASFIKALEHSPS